MKKLDDIDPGHYEARLSGLYDDSILRTCKTTLSWTLYSRTTVDSSLSTRRSPDPYDNQKVNTVGWVQSVVKGADFDNSMIVVLCSPRVY